MKQVCIKCSRENSERALYCESCGNSLGLSVTQSRTILASPQAPFETSEEKTRMIAENIEKSIGANGMTLNAGEMNASRAGQREHVIVAMDQSGSMGGSFEGEQTKLEASKRSVTALVLDKDPYDEIGIVAFNSKAQCVLDLCPIHSNKRQIFEAIQSLTPDNGTDINQGLLCSRESFDWNRNDVVRRIILESDGLGGNPLRTAEELKSRGVVIDVIGVGPSESQIDKELLQNVASVIDGQSRYTFITNSQMLTMTYSAIAGKTSTY